MGKNFRNRYFYALYRRVFAACEQLLNSGKTLHVRRSVYTRAAVRDADRIRRHAQVQYTQLP